VRHLPVKARRCRHQEHRNRQSQGWRPAVLHGTWG
jgi:hypothetical protein